MITATLTRNTTKYPMAVLDWMLDFTVRTVRKKLVGINRKCNVEALTITGYYSGRCYSGRAYNSPRPCRIIVRNDINAKYPIINRYARYKNMPEFEIRDKYEAFVYVLAHEFGHTKFPGGKEGEIKCELLGKYALEKFREVRQNFDAFLSRIETKRPTRSKRVPVTKPRINKKLAYVKEFIAEHGLIKDTRLWKNFFLDCPKGKEFEEGLTSILCLDVEDAYERLTTSDLANFVKTS